MKRGDPQLVVALKSGNDVRYVIVNIPATDETAIALQEVVRLYKKKGYRYLFHKVYNVRRYRGVDYVFG